MLQPTRGQIAVAVTDLLGGVRDWRLWHLLAWQDVKQRYRRSTLGPLWLTLSMAIQMLVMGSLLTFLLKANFAEFLPYICAGMVFWTLITQVINDGAMAFISSMSFLMQVKRPLTTYIMQTVWRNVIILGHNFVVYLVIAAIYLVVPGASIILWPLGLLLVLLCISWMALLLGILSARYRDIPMIVQSLLGVLFWGTPLMYYPDQLGAAEYVVELNPFTHVVALARAPLLGEAPTLTDWLVVAALAIVGWAFTILFFARFRARIVYWL